ncbi:gp53-like domain-containing protein [Serratia marcescens]|uniref:gp53-like domain-containing protein n=1 Tax=Serratia marcescens TaxID=615 RepID=UPI003D319CCB
MSALIIQWGAVQIAANSTQENDFPKPFTKQCYSLQVTLTYPGSGIGDGCFLCFHQPHKWPVVAI